MTAGIRRFIATMLVVLFLTLPGAVLAQDKRGANITVTLMDGSAVSGELIAVRPQSLVLLSPVGTDESVEVRDISTVTIIKKSKAGKGFWTGFLIGGIAGGVLGATGDDPTVGRGGAIVLGAITIGGICGLIGLGIGAAANRHTTIDFSGLTEAEATLELNRLRAMARMRSVQ